jgi:hypothetical protein
MFALDEEVRVSILFDGQKDEVIFPAITNNGWCAGGAWGAFRHGSRRGFRGFGTAGNDKKDEKNNYIFSK